MNLQRIEEKVGSLMSLKEKDMAKKVVELVSTERLEHDFQDSTKLMTACKMELMEQYSRRGCVLFYGLNEDPREDTTLKVLETARAMGIDIEQEEISISHRLQTMNRKPREPRPIIAKFLRRVVKNNIYKYKHRLKNSECHYNVFVNEQLTKERSRVVYQLKKDGFAVYTQEGRINYRKDETYGVINSLDDLLTHVNW